MRYFSKRGNIRKSVRWKRGMSHLCTLCNRVSRKFHAKPICFFICFLLIKKILKTLFSFIPWLLNSPDLPSYGSNSRERHTLSLLSMCLRRSTTSFGSKAPPPLPPSSPCLIFLDELLYFYVLAKILQNGAKFIQKANSWFQKSHE